MEAYPATETYPDYASALRHCGEGYDDRQLAEVTLAKTRAILSSDLKAALHPPNADATLTGVSLIPGGNCAFSTSAAVSARIISWPSSAYQNATAGQWSKPR